MAGNAASIFWLEEYSGKPLTPVGSKRKAKSKKLEFNGWGSKPLIEFLESIGKDTTEKISQHDVSDIIGKYINDNNLTNPAKKKRVLCDERLYSIFGRKTISRIKVYDLLETHYAENQDAWDDDFFFSSEEENLGEEKKCLRLEKKNYQKKRGFETPKSCFAAIKPENIKLVYLKKSLVLDLSKDFGSFEAKVVDSFVRIKSDPNNFLQKNSHQLVLVKGMKVSGNNDVNADILLQVSNFVKDVRISMLSDDDFSQEECEDLHQRMKKGLLKRPTIAELEAKARALHEDITKHHMERRQLLQTPEEQSRLLCEVPNVIAEEVEPETVLQDVKHEKDSSQISTVRETLEIPSNPASNGKLSTLLPLKPVAQSSPIILKDDRVHCHDVQEQLIRPRDNNVESTQVVNVPEENGAIVKHDFLKVLDTTQVIDLSDDDNDDNEKHEDSNKTEAQDDVRSLIWHYQDPQGDIQGPFSLLSLKNWMDLDYFPDDFKVWKTGQNRNNAVLLADIVRRMFQI
ncbi:hypothetical protein F383_12743 [Gossypium arboreum]|uniref:Uncharacterized protein n=1 Tax=Gossypium arboreum TaxID=29729 RepID=A0A0B0NDW2_GOSAR|nr:hypothetical protein F383_12743 [Gossypium arboreum]